MLTETYLPSARLGALTTSSTRQANRHGAAAGHRIAGVDDEVEQRTFELRLIDQGDRVFGGRVHDQ